MASQTILSLKDTNLSVKDFSRGLYLTVSGDLLCVFVFESLFEGFGVKEKWQQCLTI